MRISYTTRTMTTFSRFLMALLTYQSICVSCMPEGNFPPNSKALHDSETLPRMPSIDRSTNTILQVPFSSAQGTSVGAQRSHVESDIKTAEAPSDLETEETFYLLKDAFHKLFGLDRYPQPYPVGNPIYGGGYGGYPPYGGGYGGYGGYGGGYGGYGGGYGGYGGGYGGYGGGYGGYGGGYGGYGSSPGGFGLPPIGLYRRSPASTNKEAPGLQKKNSS